MKIFYQLTFALTTVFPIGYRNLTAGIRTSKRYRGGAP